MTTATDAPYSRSLHEPVQNPPENRQRWRVVSACLMGLAMALAAVTLGYNLGLSRAQGTTRQAPAKTAPAVTAKESAIIMGHEGPWGQLEYVPLKIAPPLAFIPTDFEPSVVQPWVFPEMSLVQLAAFMQTVPLAEEDRRRLMATAKLDAVGSGLVLQPDETLIRGLSPQARGRIYGLLTLHSENSVQAMAFRYPASKLEEWVHGPEIDDKVLGLIEPFLYRNGRFLFLADTSMVLPSIPNPRVRTAVLGCLAQQSTMLVRLRVDEKSDLETLEKYWSRGGRLKQVAPILESLARVPGGCTIDITHLLSAFARRRIFTYQPPAVDPASSKFDCHWTSLNFFNNEPDDRYMDLPTVSETLRTDYYRVQDAPLLGDIALFVTPSGVLFHSAVYIADDVLFTKNGNHPYHPWMFIRMEDMRDFYPTGEGVQMFYVRSKKL